MTDDPENQNDYNEQDDNSGGGGRGNFPAAVVVACWAFTIA